MEGGTVFHFVTDGIEAALEQAKAGGRGQEREDRRRCFDGPPISSGRPRRRDASRYFACGVRSGEALFAGLDLPALGFPRHRTCRDRGRDPHRACEIEEGGGIMPKFITIGYGDRAGYDRTPQAHQGCRACAGCKLVSEGALMGIAGAPVQVRNPGAAGVETHDGPFMPSRSADRRVRGDRGCQSGRGHREGLAGSMRRRARSGRNLAAEIADQQC